MRWWGRNDREEDLERELRSDLELEAAEQLEKGLSSEEAHYAARRKFGNAILVKEEVREGWGWSSVERVWQDCRYGTNRPIPVVVLPQIVPTKEDEIQYMALPNDRRYRNGSS